MPIVKYQNQEARFTKIGTLRKGAPKPERGPGRDLTYFRFDPIDEATGAAFADHYGTEPRQINIFLPYATTDENLELWQEEYSASELKHRCDGEYCYERNKRSGKLEKTGVPCPGGCQEVGRLTVIIPELRRFAYVTVLTGSAHDIGELLGNLQAIESMRGDLRGIPMVLRRVKRMISTPDDRTGKRARREKWLLSIETAPQWAASMLLSMERQSMPLLETTVGDRPALVDTRSGEILDIPEPQIEDVADEPTATYEPPAPEPAVERTVTIKNKAAAVKTLRSARDRARALDVDFEAMDDDTKDRYNRAFGLDLNTATAEQITAATNWLNKFADANQVDAAGEAVAEAHY